MSQRAARSYRRMQVQSAPKTQVLDMLFQALTKDIDAARTAIAAKETMAKQGAIDHALRILSELSAALDHGQAPDLCANLAALYDFVGLLLLQASRTLQTKPLADADKIVVDLRESFATAAREAA